MRRRTILATVGTVSLPFAGCLSWDSTARAPKTTTEVLSKEKCETGRTMHKADVRLDPDGTWPMYQYDARNSSYNPNASVPSEVTTRWRYSVCQEVDGIVTVAGGNVYPSRASIDGQNGSQEHGEWGGYQRPAVVAGTLYVGGRTLEAYDATDGSHLWSFDTVGENGGVSAPTIRDGTVYVTGNVEDSTLYAVDAETGEEQWQFTPRHECNVAPATDGERVYAIDRQGVIYGIDAATGDELWRHQTRSFHNGGPPSVANGAVYVGVRKGVFAFETANGDVRWDKETPKSGQASIGVTDDTVFVTEKICQALATDDGTERWRNESVDSGASGGACCVTSESLLVGGATLTALSRTDGTRVWEFQPRSIRFSDYRAGRIPFAPAVVGENLFVATGAGDLYALAPAKNST